jgi:tetratricopeptide (TPR) repeat protein
VPQNGKASSPKQQYLLSQIHWHLGREDEAVEHLEQAMLLDPRKTQWRYILASRLHELGHIEEARRQAKLCVREEPNREQYRRLLRELTRTELLAAPDGQSSEEETNRKP